MLRTSQLLVLALAASLPAQLRLLPAADTFSDSSSPAANHGSSVELGFGKDRDAAGNAFFRRGYLLFDLAPAAQVGRVPLRATLRYHEFRSSAAGCLDVSLHRVQAPWSESTLNWANQPGHDPVVVATACVGDNFANGWKDFDVTELVRDWLQGVQPNHGLVIRDPREISSGARRPSFGYSRDHSNRSLAPDLEIEWADRFGSPCSARALFPQIGLGGGRAAPGSTFVLRSRTVIAGSQPAVVFGRSRTAWNGQSLPLSLAFVGLPGCSLHVSADVTTSFGALSTTPWDLSVPLPNDPGLLGQTLYAQTMFQVPFSGFEASAGLGIPIGR